MADDDAVGDDIAAVIELEVRPAPFTEPDPSHARSAAETAMAVSIQAAQLGVAVAAEAWNQLRPAELVEQLDVDALLDAVEEPTWLANREVEVGLRNLAAVA